MSTVLWYKFTNGDILFVADRLVSFNGLCYYQDKVTIIRNSHDQILGFFSGCGDAYKLAELEKWLSNGALPSYYPELDSDSNVTAMFVDLNGSLFTYYGSNNPTGIPYKGDRNFIAEGANGQALMGALLSNEESGFFTDPIGVFLSIQEISIYTGGGVQGFVIYPDGTFKQIKFVKKRATYQQITEPQP